jgi:hypothetical protein
VEVMSIFFNNCNSVLFLIRKERLDIFVIRNDYSYYIYGNSNLFAF